MNLSADFPQNVETSCGMCFFALVPLSLHQLGALKGRGLVSSHAGSSVGCNLAFKEISG